MPATHHAEPQLAQAQHQLDTHATSSATGRCLTCDIPGPCIDHSTAVITFTRLRRLPRRLPGITRPELIGARRVHP